MTWYAASKRNPEATIDKNETGNDENGNEFGTEQNGALENKYANETHENGNRTGKGSNFKYDVKGQAQNRGEAMQTESGKVP